MTAIEDMTAVQLRQYLGDDYPDGLDARKRDHREVLVRMAQEKRNRDADTDPAAEIEAAAANEVSDEPGDHGHNPTADIEVGHDGPEVAWSMPEPEPEPQPDHAPADEPIGSDADPSLLRNMAQSLADMSQRMANHPHQREYRLARNYCLHAIRHANGLADQLEAMNEKMTRARQTINAMRDSR